MTDWILNESMKKIVLLRFNAIVLFPVYQLKSEMGRDSEIIIREKARLRINDYI